MSTVDHVLAACGMVRVSWSWMQEALRPGNARRNQRQLTPLEQNRRNEQAAAERRDRQKLLTAGKLLTGSSQTPANVSAIDARTRVASDVDHAAWIMASDLRADGYSTDYHPDGRSTDHRFVRAVDWISLNANRLMNADTINATYSSLSAADKHARAVAGGHNPGGTLATECPACGRRSLVWNTMSTDTRERFIACENPRCTCSGRECPCKLPERVAGMTHIWIEAGWGRLKEQLDTREAS